MYRIGLANGRYGYGHTSWDALIDAAGSERKADIIASQISRISENTGEIFAKNGVTIGFQEKVFIPV